MKLKHDSETKYLEYYAKMLLETYFSEDYYDIRKEESPDLRMGDTYGIEVTWAMFENQGQAGGILNHIKGNNVNQIDQRYVQTMSRIQTEILTRDDGVICGYVPMDRKNKASYKEIVEAYNKKKAKKYETAHTDLFIYPPLAQLDGWMGKDQIEECFDVLSDDLENPFDHIIIFEEPSLYLFDVRQKKKKFRRGTYEELTRCKKAADAYSGWSKRNELE